MERFSRDIFDSLSQYRYYQIWAGNILALSQVKTRNTEGNREEQSVPGGKNVFLSLKTICILCCGKTKYIQNIHLAAPLPLSSNCESKKSVYAHDCVCGVCVCVCVEG